MTPLFHGHINPYGQFALDLNRPVIPRGGVMLRQTSPKQMARKLAKLLRSERPDYTYLKKVFQDTRTMLEVTPVKARKRLPQLLTDKESISF